jgi:hypothetical protein
MLQCDGMVHEGPLVVGCSPVHHTQLWCACVELGGRQLQTVPMQQTSNAGKAGRMVKSQ